jgi:hypothetical protein
MRHLLGWFLASVVMGAAWHLLVGLPWWVTTPASGLVLAAPIWLDWKESRR